MAQILHTAPYLDLRAVDAWLGHRLVFQDLDLTLKTGEHTVILGPNGAGKRVNLWELRSRLGRSQQPSPAAGDPPDRGDHPGDQPLSAAAPGENCG
jgi:ABC-type ATPase with predicted acetyltransferase domain